jgi:hypothetical protein
MVDDETKLNAPPKRLGHANAVMTLNIAAHAVPGAQSRATARFDALLRRPDQARKSR